MALVDYNDSDSDEGLDFHCNQHIHSVEIISFFQRMEVLTKICLPVKDLKQQQHSGVLADRNFSSENYLKTTVCMVGS